MSEEDIEDLFVIDDQPADDEEISNSAPIPLFNSSKFVLGLLENEENDEDEDYFGEQKKHEL
jgi:hypothetical protein